MSFSFEQDRPDHRVHNMGIPANHSHIDQKYGKMGRSPMVGQLPMANGLESPETNNGLGQSEGGIGPKTSV
jgi:hypothetical protein